MINPYNRGNSWRSRLRQLGLAALVLGGATLASQAQVLNYTTANATNTTTTYTDLGSTGTAIATANTDDANSAAQAIGFTFNYNGTSFTQFVLNTNGFIKLGSTAPSAAAMFIDETSGSTIVDPFQSTDANIIAPLNVDLTAGAAGGTEYRVATTGTAPKRVCTIQWKNVQDKATMRPTQYANMSFQVRLYESTNVIELVYGAAVAGPTTSYHFTQVGLKGSSFDNGQLVQVIKQPAVSWAAATFADYSTVTSTKNLNTFIISRVAPPDAGRTFQFMPALPTDVALRTIYTLGEIATPTALPHSVQAVVTNTGYQPLTNVAVTLSVTGANTFSDKQTVATLAPGASTTVTFAAYPATLNIGTNNLTATATVAGDGNAANNTATYGQLVTANQLSYTDPNNNQFYYSNVDSTTAGGVQAVKFTVTKPTSLTNAVVMLAGLASNVTQPVTYKILVYDASGTNGAPGNVLYTSPNQTRPATQGAVAVSLGGLQVPAGSFYVGMQETSTGGAGLLLQQEEPPRTGTYYISLNGTAPWYDLSDYDFPFRYAIEVQLGAAPACDPPTAITATSTGTTTATVSFTAAAGNTGYQVVYGPAGFNPNSGGTTLATTTSPVTLTGLSPATTYNVYVRSNCTSGGSSLFTAVASFTTNCDATAPITAFPYSQNFDTILPGQTLPCGLTVLDANNDKTTWAIVTNTSTTVTSYSGPNALRYRGLTVNNVAADDWFFTPALTTTANTRYQVAFRYRGEGIVGSPSSYTEKLEVKVGPSATPAGQTTTLYTNTAITNTSYALANATSTPAVAVFTPGAGTQYVGFHVFSDANQGNLYIDDLSITASVVTATSSAALLRAVTVFPNPSTTGLFDLEIHGAQAKGSLGVQVTNALGQQVYTGTALDNYTNRLDLASLAPGLYYLQVRNGDETITRQLAIVK